MSDPRRIKNLGKIVLDLKYDDMDHPIQFHSFVDAEILKKIPKEAFVEGLKPEINKVSLKRGTELYKTIVASSYIEGPLEGFEFGNTLVEVNLPYTLHLPNHSEFEIKLSEKNIEALITMHKIWTKRAKTEEGDSDITDFFADEYVLYFSKSTILGPQLPYIEEDGWDSYIRGKNIEKINDKNGIFRYTKLYIQLNLTLPNNIEALSDQNRDKILKEVEDQSLYIVNRIIDNYREVTNEIHVRRIGKLKINFIYFTKQNIGFWVSNFNTSTAIMNRSRKEMKELNLRLSSGRKPKLHKLLLLNARDSFSSNDYTLAVVESFQALEIFLENYFVSEFKKRGDPEEQYMKVLETNLRTKDRLNILLKDLKNVSLNQQGKIWDDWCTQYDKTRNEVVHKGKEPGEKEVEQILNTNEGVINWIESL